MLCLCSIIVSAFLGTSVIFLCFTLSALYAQRRSYLFLGGENHPWLSVGPWKVQSEAVFKVTFYI